MAAEVSEQTALQSPKSIDGHRAQLWLCPHPKQAPSGDDADKSCTETEQLLLPMLCSDAVGREFNSGRGEMVQLCPFEVILLPALMDGKMALGWAEIPKPSLVKEDLNVKERERCLTEPGPGDQEERGTCQHIRLTLTAPIATALKADLDESQLRDSTE